MLADKQSGARGHVAQGVSTVNIHELSATLPMTWADWFFSLSVNIIGTLNANMANEEMDTISAADDYCYKVTKKSFSHTHILVYV